MGLDEFTRGLEEKGHEAVFGAGVGVGVVLE